MFVDIERIICFPKNNSGQLFLNFAPTFVDHNLLPATNFNGHCLINNIYIPKKEINIYISYTLTPWCIEF